MTIPCNICEGTTFAEGPGGRRSVTGVLPQCVQCGSLERHRAIRMIFNNLHDGTFPDLSVLQFSNDNSIDHSWFRNIEVSIYGGDNSLDLMRIDRPSKHYDLVICNHILEHVQYDNSAMVELGRIINPDGFVFLSFPDPARIEKTIEWNKPREDMHYHWRVYGRDVEDRFRLYVPHLFVLKHETEDPVTNALDVVYFLARSKQTALKLGDKLAACDVINQPE